MAYEFNGTNQWLDTATAPATAAPLTIGCWFRCSQNTANQVLVILEQAGTNNFFNLGVRGAVAGDPIAIVAGSIAGSVATNSTAGYTTNTWHHACAVVTSDTLREIYIDAGNKGTGTASSTPSQINKISIGRFSFGQNYQGQIAEVGVWNAALTADEVASLAKGMTCDKIRPQSLVFYAPLVRDLQDVKGGLTITNNNTATVATHPRVYA